MNAGILLAVELHNSINDGAGLLCCRGIIEVYEWATID
jgi:hypothetical protein